MDTVGLVWTALETNLRCLKGITNALQCNANVAISNLKPELEGIKVEPSPAVEARLRRPSSVRFTRMDECV